MKLFIDGKQRLFGSRALSFRVWSAPPFSRPSNRISMSAYIFRGRKRIKSFSFRKADRKKCSHNFPRVLLNKYIKLKFKFQQIILFWNIVVIF